MQAPSLLGKANILIVFIFQAGFPESSEVKCYSYSHWKPHDPNLGSFISCRSRKVVTADSLMVNDAKMFATVANTIYWSGHLRELLEVIRCINSSEWFNVKECKS